uniref:Uroporphyrinogen-III synthase n=1 Tax=Halichondria panicea TaxID=6063 RepID=A0A6C0SLG7_HALPA|nr:uroporphyrinogen-III synthase [Halichondria panicea]
MASADGSLAVAAQSRIAVLLRAPKGPEDPYYNALSVAGFQSVHFVPVLHYEHMNQDELRSDILSSDKFSGIVFTSGTAVEVCVSSLTEHERGRVTERWKQLPVFVVGKATAQAVRGLGLSPTGSHSGNAETLSKLIIEHFCPGVPTKPLLFPCGALRRETLPVALEGAGLPLKCLACYKTLPHPDLQGRLRELSPQAEVESVWVVFYSPSGVNFALDCVLKTFKSGFKVAAIGATTGDSLSKAGCRPDAVAKLPNHDSLTEAILECCI